MTLAMLVFFLAALASIAISYLTQWEIGRETDTLSDHDARRSRMLANLCRFSMVATFLSLLGSATTAIGMRLGTALEAHAVAVVATAGTWLLLNGAILAFVLSKPRP